MLSRTSRVTRTIAKFLALSTDDRWLLIQAILALPLIRAALAFGSSRRCLDTLDRLTPSLTGGAASPFESRQGAARAAWLVDVASRRFSADASCLVRSIALWWLLRRRGIPVEIRIGVRRRGERFEAHAWVEHFDCVLNDDADVADRFAPFDSLEALFPPLGVRVR